MIITHDKVLIQLDEHLGHTVTQSGLLNPKFLNIETDGGRPDIKVSNQKYVTSGTVLAIAPLAQEKMKTNLTPLHVGDKVLVSKDVVNQSFHFQADRNSILSEFDGKILISYISVEAILNPTHGS